MYCIKLSILPYQLFILNDFNDLETSDKRTSSDFNKYLKLLQAIVDIVPAPLKQLYLLFSCLHLEKICKI